VTHNGKKVTPWWKQEIKDAIREKELAYKAWLQKKPESCICGTLRG